MMLVVIVKSSGIRLMWFVKSLCMMLRFVNFRVVLMVRRNLVKFMRVDGV